MESRGLWERGGSTSAMDIRIRLSIIYVCLGVVICLFGYILVCSVLQDSEPEATSLEYFQSHYFSGEIENINHTD